LTIDQFKRALNQTDHIYFLEDPVHNQLSLHTLGEGVLITGDLTRETPFAHVAVATLHIPDSEKTLLNEAIRTLHQTPVARRNIDSWRKESAKDIYSANEQTLKHEPLSALQKHWLNEDQRKLKSIITKKGTKRYA